MDSERNRYFAGTVGSANTTGTAQANGNYGTYQGNTNTSQTPVYRVYETFIIEGDTYADVAQERLRWRWSKPASFTVNAPVKYAIEKRKLYVIDDDGKEHEMEIVKRILKQPEPAKVPQRSFEAFMTRVSQQLARILTIAELLDGMKLAGFPRHVLAVVWMPTRRSTRTPGVPVQVSLQPALPGEKK